MLGDGSLTTKPSLIELEINPELLSEKSLSDRVYTQLKFQILTCALQPGQRLVESHLCGDLNTSRTPLREALNRLRFEGLVTMRQNCGYSVMPLTIARFEDLCELRRAVEPQVAALAADKADEQSLELLWDSADLDYQTGKPETYAEYCRRNCRFHLALARATGNPLLEEIVMSALDKHQQPAMLGVLGQMSASEPTSEHRAIASAVGQGKTDLARALMFDHINQGQERIIEALRQAGIAEE